MGKRINLTYATGMVLQAIDTGYLYGFDIMDVSGLPDGTVYPALRRLQAAGLLSSRWEDAAAVEKRPLRRYYELTPEGLQRQLHNVGGGLDGSSPQPVAPHGARSGSTNSSDGGTSYHRSAVGRGRTGGDSSGEPRSASPTPGRSDPTPSTVPGPTAIS